MPHIVVILVTAAIAISGYAQEIGFVEKFSLAEDRSVPLRELIPGTEDYYYYHCLHAQNEGRLKDVRPLLAQWVKRTGHTTLAREIESRQALLEYDKNPRQSLDYIVQRLNIQFNHQRQQLKPDVDLPTRLDPDRISLRTLSARAFAEKRNLSRFEDAAFDYLVSEDLNPDQRRDLLGRLQRPDYPKLPQMVADDLKYKNSRGFGEHNVHRELLLSQLEACLKLMPELIQNTTFINVYMNKLRPSEDVEWQHDITEKDAYLRRMEAFVRRLPPAQNSLKAHVLYQRLDFDRRHGRYERDLFMDYLKLPRNAFYVRKEYLARSEFRGQQANLDADFREQTTFPPISIDEPLVRDYLMRFLRDAANFDAFGELVEHDYLKRTFAEVKLVNGIGDMEAWYSMLSPAEVRSLKDRVDIQLLPVNGETYGIDDPVRIQVVVKNVEKLIVKTYEINTMAYYRANAMEITTAVDLDGLVANMESSVVYDLPPIRRHDEQFDLPHIKQVGVYVVELIGNGISSRALIRKGRLSIAERQGSAGHVFMVFDGEARPVADAVLWLSGTTYDADEHGEIAVPYSTAPGQRPIIVSSGDFGTLHNFDHLPETYALRAGFYAEREALLAGETAHVVLRPELTVNGIPVDIGLLEETAINIQTIDHDGIGSDRTIKAPELANDRETVIDFNVPENTALVTLVLHGKVQSLTLDRKIDFSAQDTFALNGIERTEKTADLHLRHEQGRYVLQLLGRTGEVRAEHPVQLELKHRFFRETVHVSLKTDKAGAVALGLLDDIVWVRARGPEGTERQWSMVRDRCSEQPFVHAHSGEVVTVAFMGDQPDDIADVASLLEVRGGTFTRSVLDHASISGGAILIKALEPGDYDLYIKPSHRHIRIRVAHGGSRHGPHVVGQDRLLEQGVSLPLQITGIDAGEKELRIQLSLASPNTRVHVACTRFVGATDLFDELGTPAVQPGSVMRLTRPLSRYLSGRNIGDEYRYIMERRYANKFPGNLLRRPSLLLNPWSLRKTDTGTDQATAEEAWAAVREGEQAKKRYGGAMEKQEARGRSPAGITTSYQFLAEPSTVIANLKPNEKGLIVVPRAQLGDGQQIHVMAIDPDRAVYRETSLAASGEKFRDLRLVRYLDPARHFTEQKETSIAKAAVPFVIEDLATSELEIYDSLPSVYGLFTTLSGDAALAEFAFLLEWPELPAGKKQELFSKYACHELSFFLYHKDPAFFRDVIRPYLANKKDTTFLDEWLLDRDLSPYLQPWQYGRLNVCERILLAQHIKAEAQTTARHIKDRYDLIPPDIELYNRLFMTALKSHALETGDTLGLANAREQTLALMDALDSEGVGMANGARLKQLRAPARKSADKALPAPMAAAKPQAALARRAAAQEPQMPALEMEETRDRALGEDAQRRNRVRRLYRRLDKTEEWVENNYYHLPIEQQVADLVTVNAFWKDYAEHGAEPGFLSPHIAEAANSFTEMMMAMAVLELPFKPGEHKTATEAAKWSLTPANGAVVFHKEIREARGKGEEQAILVSQSFFAHNDRYRFENNEQFDKFVTDEFQTARVYGAQIVLTNPTSTRRKVDVLLQIPAGAVPVLNGFVTRSLHRQLDPYSTQTVEYYFYFPQSGHYPHYPVHVAQNEELIAFTKAFEFNVVETLTQVDRDSWPYVSQHGTDTEVLKFLDTSNIDRLDLELIAFRMRDRKMFDRTLDLLEKRHVYNHTLWSYGLHHSAPPAIRQYLAYSPFPDECGWVINSQLLTLDPVARHIYQLREYWPLVNARTYPLGGKRKILNHQFHEQYHAFLKCLQYRPALSHEDEMTATVYLLLQDRVEEALKRLDRIGPEHIESRVQYDYLKAYMAFYRESPAEARKIAEPYIGHSVPRWRDRFNSILAQADEIEGGAARVIDEEDRGQQQTALADTAPSFEFDVENRAVSLRYQNIAQCRINYYLMDIELLFSRNPFVQEVSGQFAVIRPNDSTTIGLQKDQREKVIPIPDKYSDQNVLVEIIANGIRHTKAYYPHSLDIRITGTFGQVRVLHQDTGKPLPKVYVKVYARMKDGTVRFFKDGYTDLRGRFDYASLSTNEIEDVERLSILLMSEEHGAVVRDAEPPRM